MTALLDRHAGTIRAADAAIRHAGRRNCLMTPAEFDFLLERIGELAAWVEEIRERAKKREAAE